MTTSFKHRFDDGVSRGVGDPPLASKPPRRIGAISACFCRLAGADPAMLAGCPFADRASYTIFGFLLAVAFVWIAFTVGLALSVVSDGTMLANAVCGAVGIAIASVAISVDRLFIIADTLVQGQLAIGLTTARPAWSWTKRVAIAGARIAFAAAIATTTADLFALWLDASAVEQVLLRDHHAANRTTYEAIDAQTKLIDAEIETRRRAMDGLDTQVSKLAEALAFLRENEVAGHQQDPEIVSIAKHLDELRKAEKKLVDEVALQADTMTCEELGERCRAGDSGRSGKGARHNLAEIRHANAADQLKGVRDQIKVATDRLKVRSAEISNGAESAEQRQSARIVEANTALATATTQYTSAVQAYKNAVDDREERIAAFTKFQTKQPGFVPFTTGLSEQWAALRQLHETSPASVEITWKLKIGIIAVELMAVLAKLLASPRTEYALLAYAAYYMRLIELRAKVQDTETKSERTRVQRESEEREKEQTRRAREAADRAFDELFDN